MNQETQSEIQKLRMMSDIELEFEVEDASRCQEPYGRNATKAEIWRFSRAYDEQCRRKAAGNYLPQADIPSAYAPQSLADVDPTPEQGPGLATLKKSLYGHRGAFLWGAPGRGKSYLAASWAYSSAELGRKVKFYEWDQIIDDERRHMKTQGYDPNRLTEIAKTVPELVIDDLGATSLRSEWALGIFEQILQARMLAELRTVITSNLSPGELLSGTSERITSRLGKICHIVEVGGVDLRMEE